MHRLDTTRPSPPHASTRPTPPSSSSGPLPHGPHDPDIDSYITRARTEHIDKLTSSQRAHLRSLAHHLKPILHVGTEGVSDAVIDSVREAFNTRELLKVKVHESAPLPVANAAEEIAREIPEAHVAQTIGRTMVLYRPFTEEPQIQLPESPTTT